MPGDAGLFPEDIDYINLHGTGTMNNDLSEGMAVQRIFKKVPKVSSTKPYTGHTLGACAGIEAVFCMLSMEHNDILTRVGPGTPTGELMREYWIPACLPEELKPDAPPTRLKLLGASIERIFGLTAVNQLYAAAPLMATCFGDRADVEPYRALVPSVAIDEMNPPKAKPAP